MWNDCQKKIIMVTLIILAPLCSFCIPLSASNCTSLEEFSLQPANAMINLVLIIKLGRNMYFQTYILNFTLANPFCLDNWTCFRPTDVSGFLSALSFGRQLDVLLCFHFTFVLGNIITPFLANQKNLESLYRHVEHQSITILLFSILLLNHPFCTFQTVHFCNWPHPP